MTDERRIRRNKIYQRVRADAKTRKNWMKERKKKMMKKVMEKDDEEWKEGNMVTEVFVLMERERKRERE